ncbi:MAG: hypothetical protein IPH93_10910 [Saprospiraceae bacterium]|nr:hypothetical protein [Saprospiraceae bacterium]
MKDKPTNYQIIKHLINVKALIQFLIGLLFLVSIPSFGQQTYDPYQIMELKKSFHPKKKEFINKVKSDNLNSNVQELHYSISRNSLQQWSNHHEALIQTKLELPKIGDSEFLFTEYDFFDAKYISYIEYNGILEEVQLERGIHFKGLQLNPSNASMDLSIFKDQISGFYIGSEGENITLASSSIDRDKFLCVAQLHLHDGHEHSDFNCHTDDVQHYIESEKSLNYRSSETCKKVSVSIRADYELYLRFGKNIQAVSNYVTSMFNKLNTIYRKERIQISLAELIINTTPDGFPNTTSTSALNHFRNTFKAYAGDLHLCLSGVLKNGRASLGGIAYINALCIKSYAYAYVNVNTSIASFPNYSFDVYAVAHELGHVLGSRHTHACVWGPLKNQALDNCAKVEGSCLPGAKPLKGTLMSYCHVSGQPGIDLNLGFGKEPGDLIRNTINKASCLQTYTPQNKTLSYANAHITANVQCSDGSYSHFYYDNNTISSEDDILIMSINTAGQDIGSISDGSLKIIEHTSSNYGVKALDFSAAYQEKEFKYATMNKYWEIISLKQPRIPVKIKIFFNETDLKELLNAVPSFQQSQLQLFTIQQPGDPNPENQHRYVGLKEYGEYKMAETASGRTFVFKKEADYYIAEMEITSLASIGANAKVSVKTQAPPTSSTFVEFQTVRARSFSSYQNIQWSTNKEIQSKYFVIEKSANSILFDSIGTIAASRNTLSLKSYSINDFVKSKDAYYRITMVGEDGVRFISPIVSLSSSYTLSNRLSLYPNPLGFSDLQIEYFQASPNTITTVIYVLDPYLQQVKSQSYTTTTGKNYLKISSDDLFQPFYYIQLVSGGESITQKIVIKK